MHADILGDEGRVQLRGIDACRVASRSSCGGTARVSLERAEASDEGYLTQASTANASHCGGKNLLCVIFGFTLKVRVVCVVGGGDSRPLNFIFRWLEE